MDRIIVPDLHWSSSPAIAVPYFSFTKVVIWPLLKLFARNKMDWSFGHFLNSFESALMAKFGHLNFFAPGNPVFHSFVKEVLDYFSLSSYLMIISGDLSSHSEPILFVFLRKKSLSGNFEKVREGPFQNDRAVTSVSNIMTLRNENYKILIEKLKNDLELKILARY